MSALSIDERREAAIAAMAKIAADRAAKAAEDETVLLELEVKYTGELGARGAFFEILDLTSLAAGFVVVKRGDSVVHKRFHGSKREDQDIEAYVLPNVVYPTTDEFRAIANALPNVLGRAAMAVDRLYGAKNADDAGKF